MGSSRCTRLSTTREALPTSCPTLLRMPCTIADGSASQENDESASALHCERNAMRNGAETCDLQEDIQEVESMCVRGKAKLPPTL